MFKPRGYNVALKTGSLPETISPHILKLIRLTGGVDGPIGRQFVACPSLENDFALRDCDPLDEVANEVLPGVIYKYRGEVVEGGAKMSGSCCVPKKFGRVLWTVTNFCASYCRFCTRGRLSGLNKKFDFVSDRNVEKVFSFLRKHSEINEVILSGGDPLTLPKDRFEKIVLGLADLQKRGFVDIVRIGTRLPIVNPLSVREWHYRLVGKLKNPYLMVHINHPLELTREALRVLENFRKKSFALEYSQSVLLKGVNDSAEILCELFNKLAANGIRPYYLLQNDPVPWAKRFIVPLKKAVRIWQEVKSCKSGLSGVAATCRFVVDTAGGGKIPVPDGVGWGERVR
jgi:lysine 2,3-aminomutase